ncbi:Undecaprenyl-phosphate glucose phosphotransferase [Schinkia azotoformans MEV2011]|uniref:Undecaprenyl-phosphate glucose phosphotransferase n=2 Tax=Schinkia azotoformans TaxID=1454 RepID=A0A072NR95_SCHAZ|nr:undecaprenyl-phosphate glucose phosphotransferase [Schinkia azotoformans]KEF39757.1 Undecaprenyl-phosphate glucose phosphotransferase [Schinkia azotoformans MEV2011]MEC1695024.1 undecaprenyl-phosphate glucose phosphotransferase [Schinkia azotoformans]MEC1716367.1 undecaprenyl-phosphate glucose phosphotransferase [Schinkia azotoformans]MEC1726830.1 undecaprenyl-phosphate glucose phosphotransferase [Schinkia azotoformans]MEC1740010.1 undecaprenyl-phosphate glucose phosphotransferase [Schinkia
MIRGKDNFFQKMYIVFDFLAIQASFFLAWWTKFIAFFANNEEHISIQIYFLWSIIYGMLSILIGYLFNLYYSDRRNTLLIKCMTLLKVHSIGMVCFISFLFLFKVIDFSRSFLIIYYLTILLFATLGRAVAHVAINYTNSNNSNKRYIVIVGAGQLAYKFYHQVSLQRQQKFEVIGFLDDYKQIHDEKHQDLSRIIGKTTDLQYVLDHHLVDEVVLTLPLSAYEKYAEIVDICERNGVRLFIIPSLFKIVPARPHVEMLGDIPLVTIRDIPLDEVSNSTLKRLFDIVFSIAAILVTMPLMVAIAIIIKLTSKGPLIFKQERIGKNNRPFLMYKFRSMKFEMDGSSDTLWTTANDPRKTKFGAFIRRTSLDELPQFFNVLKGDMSIVGPRPERPFFVEQFKEQIPKYMVKHHVRPGITGWAQVNGLRGDTSINTRIIYDIFYIENWSFLLDLKIILKTIANGFINKNAY